MYSMVTTYTRGETLANLSSEQRAVGNGCDEELPDHLSNILRLIARMEDRQTLNDLVRLYVAPAVETSHQRVLLDLA